MHKIKLKMTKDLTLKLKKRALNSNQIQIS